MRRVFVLTAVAVLTLTALPALGQDYPPDPGAGSAALSDTAVVPGQVITVSGSGWLPGSEVTITIFSTPRQLGTATVDGDGQFSTQVTIPSDLSPGEHTLRVEGTNADNEPRTVDVAVTVAEPGAAADPDLAVTGEGSLLAGLMGIGLLGAGGGALVLARRRQATHGA